MLFKDTKYQTTNEIFCLKNCVVVIFTLKNKLRQVVNVKQHVRGIDGVLAFIQSQIS